jgi:hypothetical protein
MIALRWRDFAAGLGLASFLFIVRSKGLIDAAAGSEEAFWYTEKRINYIAALCMFAVTVAALTAIAAAMRSGSRTVRIAAYVLLSIGICLMVSKVPLIFPVVSQWILEALQLGEVTYQAPRFAFLLGAVMLLAAFWRWRTRVFHALVYVAPALSPAVVPTAGRVAWIAATSALEAAYAPVSRAKRLPADTTAHRVVIVLFDGLDYRSVFDLPPADLALPHFDSLRERSVHTSMAYPPAYATEISMLSYFMGERVDEVVPRGPRSATLRMAGGDRSSDSIRTMFDDARAAGRNAGYLGWFMPFCRMPFSAALSECIKASYKTATGTARPTPTLLAAATELLQIESPDYEGLVHIREHLDALAAAKRLATDPTLGLVFLHMPLPHTPCIYDRRAHRFDPSPGKCNADTYASNVALVDQTLGEILDTVSKAGLYDRTTFVVTSDHFDRFREAREKRGDLRIPFLVQVAGQREEISIDSITTTTGLRWLVADLLAGRLRTHSEVARWLYEHASIAGPPSFPGYIGKLPH